ncbi:MAG: peptidylprolyl isomerase [Kofleriaceae bacterium]|nr:peptidylprolyl isomerase [Kofleriaceae bacterium]
MLHVRSGLACAALLLMTVGGGVAIGCGSKPVPATTPGLGSGRGSAVEDPATAGSPVISKDILAREPVANTASIKHILLGWRELGDRPGGRVHERAAQRSKKETEAEVTALLEKLKAGADFDSVMKASSEDEGSASIGKLFEVTPDAQLVIEFRQLGLRLNVGEIGVCESDFGFHIMKRYQ